MAGGWVPGLLTVVRQVWCTMRLVTGSMMCSSRGPPPWHLGAQRQRSCHQHRWHHLPQPALQVDHWPIGNGTPVAGSKTIKNPSRSVPAYSSPREPIAGGSKRNLDSWPPNGGRHSQDPVPAGCNRCVFDQEQSSVFSHHQRCRIFTSLAPIAVGPLSSPFRCRAKRFRPGRRNRWFHHGPKRWIRLAKSFFG
jgi:hypothetical protein